MDVAPSACWCQKRPRKAVSVFRDRARLFSSGPARASWQGLPAQAHVQSSTTRLTKGNDMKDTDQKTLEAMERYGGSFCNALAKAAFLADDSNMEAFQHGISTVVNALEAAEKTGLENLQTQVLDRVVEAGGRGKWRPIDRKST